MNTEYMMDSYLDFFEPLNPEITKWMVEIVSHGRT